MIPYRPVPPLTLGPRNGWRSVLAAVVMAALVGTTATSAVAAERTETSAAGQAAQAAPAIQETRSGQALAPGMP